MASTKPEGVGDRDRALQGMRLRRDGKTWDEVAKECGYSDRSTAHRAVSRVLARVEGETVDDYRNLMDARLEALWQKAMEAIEKADPERHVGLSQLLQAAVRIEDRRAKLFGIDGATKSETTVVVKSAIDAEIEQLVDHLKHQPNPQESK